MKNLILVFLVEDKSETGFCNKIYDFKKNVRYLHEKYVVKFSCGSVRVQLNCKTGFSFESISIISVWSVSNIFENVKWH